MSTLYIRNQYNNGWINAASTSGFRIRNADNTGWLDAATSLSKVFVRNSDNTGWLSFSSSAPPPPPPPPQPNQLTLAANDLDFYYLPVANSSSPTVHNYIQCEVDTSLFFSKGADHIVFALDCIGGQGSNNPHCGPIYRRGENLWAHARGFIIFGDGTVRAEHWNGTSNPGLATITNTLNTTFRPATTPKFAVRIFAGYRSGTYANRMEIKIHAISGSAYRPVFFGVAEGWGWDWTGTHKCAIGAIGPGFVSPNSTGCSEQLVPRIAPNAVLPFNNFYLEVV